MAHVDRDLGESGLGRGAPATLARHDLIPFAVLQGPHQKRLDDALPPDGLRQFFQRLRGKRAPGLRGIGNQRRERQVARCFRCALRRCVLEQRVQSPAQSPSGSDHDAFLVVFTRCASAGATRMQPYLRQHKARAHSPPAPAALRTRSLQREKAPHRSALTFRRISV